MDTLDSALQSPASAAGITPRDAGVTLEKQRVDRVVLVLTLLTLVGVLGLTINPWPRDGWYSTQYFLVGSFLGQDDYTPIAAPALLYRVAHAIAALEGRPLAGEFYIAAALQNLLVLLSGCCVYYALRLLRMRRYAGPVAIGSTLLILSTGLPQAFWSETSVLFLMSGVVLVLAFFLRGGPVSRPKFWQLAVLCGVLVGMLVVTRMTPVLLIPAIALLFFRRMPVQQIVKFTATLTLITALLVVGVLIANHARFGRYELTNSSGRHLWNGVTEFADSALAHSAEYAALKTLDPNIQGKSWQHIPSTQDLDSDRADPREPVLARLSKQAIRNAPVTYLLHGGRKFVRTIGAAPYRLGYGSAGPQYWNPLQRNEPLPSLSALMGIPPAFGALVEAGFRWTHAIVQRIYPITIFMVTISGLAMLLERVGQLLRRHSNLSAVRTRTLLMTAFLSVGIVLTAIPLASGGLKLGILPATAVCIVLLGAAVPLLHRALGQHQSAAARPKTDTSLFLFLTLMFFGSLWLSWQLESPNPRNTLPYLPFWAVMLAMGVRYWKDLRVSVASPRFEAHFAR